MVSYSSHKPSWCAHLVLTKIFSVSLASASVCPTALDSSLHLASWATVLFLTSDDFVHGTDQLVNWSASSKNVFETAAILIYF